MNTDDLIHALAADSATTAPTFSRQFVWLFGVSVLAAAGAFLALLEPRTDAIASLGNVRFLFKFVFAATLALSMAGLVVRLAQPGADLGAWRFGALAAPCLLLIAVLLEMASLPATSWAAALIGQNAQGCLIYIPLIGLFPLALLLLALRRGAPADPMRAGLVAGLVAGAIAASFYAAHCPDDSPFFVAVWYSLAVSVLALLGAVIGSRVLRW